MSVIVVAMTAKKTCRVPRTAAARAPIPSALRRWMFSVTTIASSTTKPVARTSDRRVMRLIENPNSQIAARDPISDTGIATRGISVVPIRPRDTQMTITTISSASAKDVSTSLIEPRMKMASSLVTEKLRSGKRSPRRLMAF